MVQGPLRMDDSTRRADAWHLGWVIADMARLESTGHLGPEGRLLLQRYQDWYAWLASAAPATPATTEAAPPAPPS
ncbi:MAG: hypothetical protein ACREQ5_34035, partial [Candidatus Dormibacteria bacterium]